MLLVCVQIITPDFLRRRILASIVWRRNHFWVAPKEGGMLLFNPLFAFLFFYSFQRLNNMYAYLGPRDGQSYNGVLARKIPLQNTQGLISDEFIITKHTIALFHLYLASSLDSGIALKREKAAVYAAHVQTLMKMNGADGGSNRRKGLAELLSKWHPVFQGVKARKGHRASGTGYWRTMRWT
jgi:hypothetical protein